MENASYSIRVHFNGPERLARCGERLINAEHSSRRVCQKVKQRKGRHHMRGAKISSQREGNRAGKTLHVNEGRLRTEVESFLLVEDGRTARVQCGPVPNAAVRTKSRSGAYYRCIHESELLGRSCCARRGRRDERQEPYKWREKEACQKSARP